MKKISEELIHEKSQKIFSSPFLKEKITNILSNTELSEKERFLLEYIRLVGQFRLSLILRKNNEKSSILEEIDFKEKEGREFNFSENELAAINIFIRKTYEEEGDLNGLIKRIKEKLAIQREKYK